MVLEAIWWQKAETSLHSCLCPILLQNICVLQNASTAGVDPDKTGDMQDDLNLSILRGN